MLEGLLDVGMDGGVILQQLLVDQDLEQASYLRIQLIEGIPKTLM